MRNTTNVIPYIIQACSLFFIALWWTFFISWQPGMIRLVEALAYQFEPPAVSSDVVSQATSRALTYTFKQTSSSPDVFFSASEVSHLQDVAHVVTVVRTTLGILSICGWVVLIGTFMRFRGFEKRVYNFAHWIVLVAEILLVTAFLFFVPFFDLFHQVLFPGGNWEFAADSMLIQLFPLAFWKIELAWILISMLLFSAVFRVLSHGSNGHEE